MYISQEFIQRDKSDSANVNRIGEIDGKGITTLLIGQCSPLGMNKDDFFFF